MTYWEIVTGSDKPMIVCDLNVPYSLQSSTLSKPDDTVQPKELDVDITDTKREVMRWTAPCGERMRLCYSYSDDLVSFTLQTGQAFQG